MTVSELLKIASNEVGVKEKPSGSNNVKYNHWYYNKPEVYGSAYPWCAAFVSWCFRGTKLVKKTASCNTMLDWFEKNKQLVSQPAPGDIVFFKFAAIARRTNHVGIVERVDGKTIYTIEGNTSLKSSDNGGCVMRRKRSKSIVAFARPAYENENNKLVVDIVQEVIDGAWGNGAERKRRLTQAGYDYRVVQDAVNKRLRGR